MQISDVTSMQISSVSNSLNAQVRILKTDAIFGLNTNPLGRNEKYIRSWFGVVDLIIAGGDNCIK